MRRQLRAVIVLALPVAAWAAGLAIGSVRLSASELWSALQLEPGLASDIVWGLRAPRVAAAFCAGGLLAVAGAFMQALLRNPLADPYIFGVSGGAALGVLLAMVLGLGSGAGAGLGFAGAASMALLVALLAYRAGDWNPFRLLLVGVVVAAGLNALISLLLTLAPGSAVKGMLFWLMGDLTYARVPGVEAALLLGLVLLGGAAGQAINVLGLGRLKAASLGVEVNRLELALYAGAAAATTGAVLLGGTIGFVGLIVPHLVRLVGVHDYRALVPLSAVVGGSLLTLADTAARSVWAPIQLPTGILTALIGVPVLLLLVSARSDAAR
ncbi:MAG TPA: iron ABC transporter permease [Burkholderiales bacterium]|jgi:iron complex transport system permease protein|nr:iron ABC transporter permease [Burkholderiales bacterium]